MGSDASLNGVMSLCDCLLRTKKNKEKKRRSRGSAFSRFSSNGLSVIPMPDWTDAIRVGEV